MQTALLIRQYLLQFCYGVFSSRNNSAATMSVSDFCQYWLRELTQWCILKFKVLCHLLAALDHIAPAFPQTDGR